MELLPPRPEGPKVGLFVTCLVNLFRPSVGVAAIELLEAAGCRVEIPPDQTCCGLPGFNAGALRECRKIARRVIAGFEPYDYVVVPSGSCAAMIARNYHEDVLTDEPLWRQRAERLGKRTFELTAFLVDVMGFHPKDSATELQEIKATYHDSCSCLRRMKVKDQPRRLLKELRGIRIREMERTEECCGFGGSFSIKMPEIASRLADEKINNALAAGADILVGADMGCLLHLASRIKKRGESLRVMHVAEVLTGRGAPLEE